MAVRLVIPDLSRDLDVGVLQFFPSPSRQAEIFQRGNYVVELGFEALQFCAKHLDLHFPAEDYAAHLAMSSFLLNPRIPCFWPTFLKAAIAESR